MQSIACFWTQFGGLCRDRVFVCLLLAAIASPAISQEPVLPDGHGYILIRIETSQRLGVNVFEVTNVDSDATARAERNDFRAAGSNGWLALLSAPAGRYFWSEYEAYSGNPVENSRHLEQSYRRSRPTSANDSFEVVAGMVNYVGDWTMRVGTSSRRQVDPVIQYDKSTMERYVTEFPSLANRHPIYLAMMGKEAISLEELARIMQEQGN